jgi:hypothetical protein
MATLEDLGRMAMVEIDDDALFPEDSAPQRDWGTMALMLAASAAVCGVVVGLQRTTGDREK